MTSKQIEKVFELMQRYGVQYFKNTELEIHLGNTPLKNQSVAPVADVADVTASNDVADIPPQAIPPTEDNTPHHPNEVTSLLKLSDEDLVDKLFPDFSNQPPKG
jgi:hypothetical protein